MKTSKFGNLARKSRLYLLRSSPTILTVIGCLGVVVTSVMTAKATPKAVELIRQDSCCNHDGDPHAFTKIEAIQSCWKCYIPTAIVGVLTISCIFGANFLNKRNQASLASAYALLSESYNRYRKAAKTVYGDDADSNIRIQMAKDAYVSADGYSLYSLDEDKESEKILCYDLYSQRYFRATIAAVINAQYHVNRNLCLRGDVPINEFYEFLGIDEIPGGDDIGWSIEYLYSFGFMWLEFENRTVEMDDGLKCLVISSFCDPENFRSDFMLQN